MLFKPASKKQARARVALIGPSGSGKTFSALSVATGLGGRIAVIDSERGSASKYADKFAFDALDLETFSPETYVKAIEAAGAAGYDVLVIDSLSHAWTGKDGALEQVDKAVERAKARSGRDANSFTAWREVTPMHNALVDAILLSRCHVLATMRVKTEYVLEENERGKKVPRKIGLAPIQRDGLEYEFDVVGDMNEATLTVTKTRCSDLHRAVIREPGVDLGNQLSRWLSDGAPAPVREPPPPSHPATAAAALPPSRQPTPPSMPAVAASAANDTEDSIRGDIFACGRDMERLNATMKLLQSRIPAGDPRRAAMMRASRDLMANNAAAAS